jgi:hypothetical protein
MAPFLLLSGNDYFIVVAVRLVARVTRPRSVAPLLKRR